MARVKLKSVVLFLMLAAAPAMAVDYRWTLGWTQGTAEAIIRNSNDSSFDVYCPDGQEDKTPGIFLQVKGIHPVVNEQITVQIIIDGNNHSFYFKESQYQPVSRQDWWQFTALIEALASSKQKSFVVEYPKYNKAETFSLLDARKSLGAGKRTIITPCDQDR